MAQAALNVVIKLRDKISAKLKKMGKGWEKWGALGIAATALIVQQLVKVSAALVKVIEDQARAAAAAQHFADRLGTTTEVLSEFAFVAERSGVSVEGMNVGLQRMSRRIGEAAARGGEFSDFMESVGLDAKTLARQSLDEQFLAVATAIEGADNQAQKMADTFRFFDTEGVGILQTLAEDGVAGFEAALREANKFGATISSEYAAAAVKFEQSNLRMTTSIGNVKDTLTAELLPAITEAMNTLAVMFSDPAFIAGLAALGKFAGTVTKIIIDVSTGALKAIGFMFGGSADRPTDEEAIAAIERQRQEMTGLTEMSEQFNVSMDKQIKLNKEAAGVQHLLNRLRGEDLVLAMRVNEEQVSMFELMAGLQSRVNTLLAEHNARMAAAFATNKESGMERLKRLAEERQAMLDLGPPITELTEITLTHEQQVTEALDKIIDKWKTEVPQALNTAMVSFSVSLARAFRDSKGFAEKMKATWETLVNNLIAMLIRLAIQAAITAIIMSIVTGGTSGAIAGIRAALSMGSGGGSGPIMLRPPSGLTPSGQGFDTGDLSQRGAVDMNIQASFISGTRAERFDLAQDIIETAMDMGILPAGAQG